MGLRATCDHCGKDGLQGMYLITIQNLSNDQKQEPKVLCQHCLDEIFGAPGEVRFQPARTTTAATDYPNRTVPDDEPLTDGKTDIPDEPPAETLVPVPVPTYGSEETQFEDMALRTFLNTQYYKTANKDVIFYDAFGSDIRNFHHVLDNRIRTVNEGKDKISVMLK